MIRTVAAAVLCIQLAAPATAQTLASPAGSAEDDGASEGQVDGRREGLEIGRELGRAQVLADTWQRAFRRGVTTSSTWSRGHAWDDGFAEGLRPGRAEGLSHGHARGAEAASAAFLRLEGRPVRRTEAAPAPPASPAAPHHEACREPPAIHLRFTDDIARDVSPRDAEHQEHPLGWDVPKPDYPGTTDLRTRARRDGHEGDAIEAWLRGYKRRFRDEFEAAFRAQRDQVPGNLLRQWELDGEAAGRREGARRQDCESFHEGFRSGWRDGYAEGFDRGFQEGWDGEEQRHAGGPVVRLLGARLLDASDDGVIEPGEGVLLAVEVINAGLRPAEGDAMTYDGVTSLAVTGALSGPLPAQSRRDERLDLGRVDAGAPFGAGVVVRAAGARGDDLRVEAVVGRPVILEGVEARLAADGDRLVADVVARVRNVSTQRADRELSVEGVALVPLEPGESRAVPLRVGVEPSAAALGATGAVRLRSGGTTWLQREWATAERFGDALLTVARLPSGSPASRDALAALSRRLHAELDRALDEPKLYARLDDGSDLSELARVRGLVPAAAAADVEALLSRPLRDRAEAKGTPRRVRKAIREALGRDG